MLLSVPSGTVTDAEIQAQQLSIKENPRFQKDFVQLWDSRDASPADNRTDPINVQFVGSPVTRRAIVVSSVLTFGLGRQVELSRYDMHQGGLRIYNNLDDALEWIGRTREDYDAMMTDAEWIEI